MLDKFKRRVRRHLKIRSTISWTSELPRLSIYRSNSNIYAQLIDDVNWKTLLWVNDLKLDKSLTKTQKSQKVWEEIAKKAKELNITNVVFDRGWFSYHGRVKALADSARSNGLNF